MSLSTRSLEHALHTPPFARSPMLRAAVGEILRVGSSREADLPERSEASLAWVTRAQDACADGAFSGGFRLLRGWRGSDAATTAAAISMLREVPAGDGRSLERRARRAAEALAALPLNRGDWCGAADALRGLACWAGTAPAHERGRALARVADARERLDTALDTAGDPDVDAWPGAARVAAALAAAASVAGDAGLADRAGALLDRARSGAPLAEAAMQLARQPPARWPRPRGITLLPILLRDLRDGASSLGREDLLALADEETERLLRRFEIRRRVALSAPPTRGGRVPSRFSPLAWASAALLWIELCERTGDPRPLNAALFALDTLARVQRRRPDVQDVHGALPETITPWHHRLVPSYDTLAAVMLARALAGARRALALLEAGRPSGAVRRAPDVPRVVTRPARSEMAKGRADDAAPRVVIYAAPDIHRAPALLERWREWNFVPAAVVMERRPRPPLVTRLRRRLAEDGWRGTTARIAARLRRSPAGESTESTAEYCARRGIRVVDVGALDAPETVERIRALAPDLAIHVGSGLLRAPLLSVPRLGTLNIHNGVLPWFRGVNVAEWSALLGEPVGCTVHLVDPGVDTGDILLVREVDVRGARSIEALRRRVDRAQAGILGEVLRAIVEDARLPERRAQRAGEGRQFFRMHPLLRDMLEERLRAAAEC